MQCQGGYTNEADCTAKHVGYGTTFTVSSWCVVNGGFLTFTHKVHAGASMNRGAAAADGTQVSAMIQ